MPGSLNGEVGEGPHNAHEEQPASGGSCSPGFHACHTRKRLWDAVLDIGRIGALCPFRVYGSKVQSQITVRPVRLLSTAISSTRMVLQACRGVTSSAALPCSASRRLM